MSAQSMLRVASVVVSQQKHRVPVTRVFVIFHVIHPSVGEEHKPGCHHRFKPWEWPLAGVLLNSFIVDEMFEKRMLRPSKDESIVDSDWPFRGRCGQEWGSEKLVQWLFAFHVHIEVNATIMIENEVAKDVGALNRLAVGSVVLVEMRVLGVNPFGGDFVCPEPVLLTFLALVQARASAVRLLVLLNFTVTMLLKPDVVHNFWHQCIVRIARNVVNMIFERDIELAFDLVEVDVGVDSFAKVTEQWVDFVLQEFPGDNTCQEEYESNYPSQNVHCLGPNE
jgi:hypothetical protein